MTTVLHIPQRFNGPPDSGNGGYSSGRVAAFVEGVATVRLHAPPPLGTDMTVQRVAGGGVELYDGERLIASGKPAELELDVPPAPSVDDARRAMDHFPLYEGHTFPTCFVCGPKRPNDDGLALYAGPLPGSDLVASLWVPAPDMYEREGVLLPEMIWSALDCPGYTAAFHDDIKPAVLGEITAEITAAMDGRVGTADPLVVYAWPLGGSGRKFLAGTAVADASGALMARAQSTWIVLG